MRRALAFAMLAGASSARAQSPRLLDAFDQVTPWTAYASDGVGIALETDGGTLRADIDYRGGAGYAVIHRPLSLALPENYAFRFKLRGTLPRNNVEFKLLDESGDNVWWSVQRNFAFDSGWREIVIPHRDISFAWGPAGGGTMRRVAALEIAVTAGEGGKGSVWFDSLMFVSRPPVDTTLPIRPVRVTSVPASPGAARAMDGDTATSWLLSGKSTSVVIDLGHLRGFGAARISWAGDAPPSYAMDVSVDGRTWNEIYSMAGSDGQRDYLLTGAQESRWIRLRAEPGPGRPRLREITLLPIAAGADANRVIEQMARDARPGLFPRSFTGSLGFWTVVGADRDSREALVEESGRVEVDDGFSIEPFLQVGDSLFTWHNVALHDSLAQADLPLPIVSWRNAPVELEASTWTTGTADSSTLMLQYRLTNPGSGAKTVELLLALRPLQVNPPSQFLNRPGGIGHVRELSIIGDTIHADSARVILLRTPDSAGFSSVDAGDVSRYLAERHVPRRRTVVDERGLAGGLLAYRMELRAGESRTVVLAVPWHAASRVPDSAGVTASWQQAVSQWASRTRGFELDGPAAVLALEQTIRASVGYILVNRDSAAIQPGSRAYSRSWIRDAALTSSALLRLGITEPVKEFLEWFAPFQFETGKIPCCVDHRGADPVPENDSQGEFIYLATEYARRTGDTALLRALWPHISAAASYMDSLRHSRMTGAWIDSLGGAFYGLMPESISHEGYSAHPEHSYWDDFWAARGFDDAAEAARRLGLSDAVHWQAVADSFRRDLLASVRRAMAVHHLDFIPGSVELGDFDATSTTIAGDPVDLLDSLPRAAVERTFSKFDSVLADRRAGKAWTAYTPYEARVVGTKVRLGWREAALRQVADLLGDQRPPGWRQWPEVIRRDARAPEFLGDLPHTWVASDFTRSVLDLFVYESGDHSLTLLAGVPREWLQGKGVHLRVPWSAAGAIEYDARLAGETLQVHITSVPQDAEALYLQPPLEGRLSATASGRDLPVTPRGIRLPAAPADVSITVPRPDR
ncbi:MAG TPA: discoidin domain-containing protein [Gemmatimonadales bacterium]|nr:discoidin domain-containing protein [Gemmatimonadales bacterium]